MAHTWRPQDARLRFSAVTLEAADVEPARVLQRAHRRASRPYGSPYKLWQAEPSSAAKTLVGVLHNLAASVRPAPGFNRAGLATLPKGVDREDRCQHAAQKARAIRPLALSSTDSRVVASATVQSIKTDLSSEADAAQRGLEAHSHVLASAVDAGVSAAFLLLHLAAAFPSVSCLFLLEGLRAEGFPLGCTL